MSTLYIALGANLGRPQAQLMAALDLITAHLTLQACSPLYLSPPKYNTQQPPFTNAVCAVSTSLPPLPCLHLLQRLEDHLGRQRDSNDRNGPRCIDLDLLLYGQQCLATPELTLPHPRMLERRFVLQPLADIAPQLHHPIANTTITQLRDACPDPDTLTLLAPAGWYPATLPG